MSVNNIGGILQGEADKVVSIAREVDKKKEELLKLKRELASFGGMLNEIKDIEEAIREIDQFIYDCIEARDAYLKAVDAIWRLKSSEMYEEDGRGYIEWVNRIYNETMEKVIENL